MAGVKRKRDCAEPIADDGELGVCPRCGAVAELNTMQTWYYVAVDAAGTQTEASMVVCAFCVEGGRAELASKYADGSARDTVVHREPCGTCGRMVMPEELMAFISLHSVDAAGRTGCVHCQDDVRDVMQTEIAVQDDWSNQLRRLEFEASKPIASFDRLLYDLAQHDHGSEPME